MTRTVDLPTDPQTDNDILFLHNDEEEDLVGSDLHQDAVLVAYQSLRSIGRRRGLPWHVSDRLMVLMERLSGKEWRPCPDITVHTTVGIEPLTSLNAAVHGMPEVVMEVASHVTWDYDVELKRRMYGRVGVQEYLVFDPTGEFFGTPLRAWHATERGFVPWLPDPDDRLHSDVLDLWFRPEDLLLRVFDRDGSLVLTFQEQELRIAELEARLRALTRG